MFDMTVQRVRCIHHVYAIVCGPEFLFLRTPAEYLLLAPTATSVLKLVTLEQKSGPLFASVLIIKVNTWSGRVGNNFLRLPHKWAGSPLQNF